MSAIQLEDTSIRVLLNDAKNDAFVTITDLANGAQWRAKVPARLEVLSLGEQRVHIIPFTSVATKVGDQVEFTLESPPRQGVRAVVCFRIDDGELVVEIPSERISETNPEVALLSGIEILPGMMTVDPDDSGHLVLPLQSGVLCWPARHQRFQDRFLIYGEQDRWEDLPLLPACGAVCEKKKSALLSIAASGDCDAECRVSLDGHGAGTTGFATRYRYTPVDPVDPIDRVFRFVPLHGADAGYAGMGRRLYRHLRDTAGRGTLAERASVNPQLEYAATSYTLKIFHAHKKIGTIDGTGEYQVWATFDQAAEQLAFLKRRGIERVWTQSVGWNPDGHDGAWPTRFPVDERLGGAAGFRRLLEAGKNLGYMISVHDNYLDNYKRAIDWNTDFCCGSLYGGPLKQGMWSGGQNHRGWGFALPDTRLRDQLLKMKDLGIDAAYYIDAMGMPLEISYNLAHGERRYRRACAEGQVRIMHEAENIFGGTGTEMGFAYLAMHTDSIASAQYPGLILRNRELADRQIPWSIMALRGLVFFEAHQTHRYVLEKNRWPGLAHHLLTLAETGIKPRAETSYVVPDWGAYPVELCVDGMKAAHDLMLVKLRSTALAQLQDHELMDGDPVAGDHVTRSYFSDGTEVVCDFGKEHLEINGQPYALPTDFVKRPPQPVGTRPKTDYCVSGTSSR